MKIYNIIDEQGRMAKLPKYILDGNGQYISHTISYLCAREILKRGSNEEHFGLELKVKSKELEQERNSNSKLKLRTDK